MGKRRVGRKGPRLSRAEAKVFSASERRERALDDLAAYKRNPSQWRLPEPESATFHNRNPDNLIKTLNKGVAWLRALDESYTVAWWFLSYSNKAEVPNSALKTQTSADIKREKRVYVTYGVRPNDPEYARLDLQRLIDGKSITGNANGSDERVLQSVRLQSGFVRIVLRAGKGPQRVKSPNGRTKVRNAKTTKRVKRKK